MIVELNEISMILPVRWKVWPIFFEELKTRWIHVQALDMGERWICNVAMDQ